MKRSTWIPLILASLVWVGIPSILFYDVWTHQQFPIDYWLYWGLTAVINLRIARYMVVQPVTGRNVLALWALALGPVAWVMLWLRRKG